MSFLSFTFALCLALFLPIYWLVPAWARKTLLLFASLAFYAAAFPPHAALIVAATVAVFLLAPHVAPRAPRAASRALFIAGILGCVALLGAFKYSRLLVQTVSDLGGPALRAPDWRIPLGISFFTFEFVHYLTDVRLGKLQPARGLRGLRDFGLFTLFFPTLLSGPIKRYQSFFSLDGGEGDQSQRFRPAFLAEGLTRMALGIGKKVILADSMTSLSGRLLIPDQVTPMGLWMAMYAYAIKIYFDFSGYTDIAIGCARLLGYRVPENFDRPYQRENLSEFWRHWHMSLSSWIRDYLFIPLGGSRVSPLRAAVNLTLVMALCGLWHGASWNFVAWGLWQGLGLVVLRLFQRLKLRLPAGRFIPGRLGRLLGVGVTFHYVCFGWVLFAAPSLGVAVRALRRMWGV